MHPYWPARDEHDIDDKSKQTLSRLEELFGAEPVPELFHKMAVVPALLSDYYMNFKKFVHTEGKLSVRDKTLIGVVVSHTAGVKSLTEYFATKLRSLVEGDDKSKSQFVADVLAVQATCAMYNVFFKFRDLSGSDLFSGMPVGLRAHTFAGTGLTDREVELINITVSDVNGCKPCTEGHVAKARQLGLSDDAILESIQCAATVYAGCQFAKVAV
ncbi:MAG: hypothetical protein C0478_02220 [Planctomyces sp.]|nr:hypothetical protein [Planctomyces sp.]